MDKIIIIREVIGKSTKGKRRGRSAGGKFIIHYLYINHYYTIYNIHLLIYIIIILLILPNIYHIVIYLYQYYTLFHNIVEVPLHIQIYYHPSTQIQNVIDITNSYPIIYNN